MPGVTGPLRLVVMGTGPFAVPDSPFDKDADFIIRYADRRKRLENEPGLRVDR